MIRGYDQQQSSCLFFFCSFYLIWGFSTTYCRQRKDSNFSNNITCFSFTEKKVKKKKRNKKKNTSGQKLNNDLCVHASVTNIRGHNRGLAGADIKGSQVGWREGKKKKEYHIDTYTHPVLLQRQPPTGSLPPIQYNSDKKKWYLE